MSIPNRLRDEFMGFMQANDHDDLSDGAWFAMLEEAALHFIESNYLDVDENDAVFEYLEMCDEG